MLLKRMQAFVEEYEGLKHELGTSKQPIHQKYKRLTNGLDRCVQVHLKNGVPRIASSKARKSRKADGEKEGGA